MPHLVIPVPQLAAQVPLVHAWPVGQALPHDPQLALSFWRLAQ